MSKNREPILYIIKNFFISLFQLIAALVAFVLSLFIFRTKVYNEKLGKIKPGTIIISNHQSRFDPLIVTFHLGFWNLIRSLPVKYPTAHEVINEKIVGHIIKLLGGYDIGKTPFEKAKKLLYTRELLINGTVILLFPEGRVVKETVDVNKFQKGIDLIFKENIPLVCARIEGMNNWSWINVPKRHQARVEYSELIDGISLEEKQKIVKDFYSKNEDSN